MQIGRCSASLRRPFSAEQQPVLRGSVDGQDNAEDLAFVVVFVDAEQLEGFIGGGDS